MAHVLCIEPVVAQLVHHDFISREVVASFAPYLFYAKQEGGLAELIAMRSVLEVAYRADSEYDVLSGSGLSVSADAYDLIKSSCGFIKAEPFSAELICRSLKAVGYDEVLFHMPETPACAEGYDYLSTFPEMPSGLFQFFVSMGKKGFSVFTSEGCVV